MPTRFFRSTAAAAAVGAGSLCILGSPASAQTCYPPSADCVSTTSSSVGTGNPSITLSATTVARGQTVGAVIGGFQGSSSGILTIASVEQQIGSFNMPAAGPATASITIPSNISLGAHTVFARGTALNGQSASASQRVTVVAAGTVLGNGGSTSTGSSGGNLARTGAIVIPTAIVGAGLVLGGLALKRSSKRSSSTTSV